MNGLFSQIDESIEISHNGWCSKEKARTLAVLMMAIKPSTTVEIGVYTGKSAISMALTHKFLGHGQIVCIDPWSASASTEGYDGANKEWWSGVDHGSIYKEFMTSIIRFGVTAQIDIRRAKSDQVDPPKNIGLFHCDGQHTIQAVRDVERFAPNVIQHGFVVMDDLTWGNGEVTDAAQKLIPMGFVELFKLGTGAVFQRK